MSRLFTLQEVNDLELSAVEAERERIIKILQDEVDFYKSGIGQVEWDSWRIEQIESQIALIKGETNGL